MKKNNFILAILAIVFVFSGCVWDDSVLIGKINDHEKRIKAIEKKLEELNTLNESVKNLESYYEKIEGLELAVNEIKKEQQTIHDSIENNNLMSENEVEKLNDDIKNLKEQLFDLNAFVETTKTSVKTIIFKNNENKSIVAFVSISTNMIVHIVGNGNLMMSEIDEDISLYIYYVNGHKILMFDGLTVNNFIRTDDIYYPRIEDAFGISVCNYIVDSYSELIKDNGYKVCYGNYNSNYSYKTFDIKQMSKQTGL